MAATQVENSTRATVRTVLAALVGLVSLVPTVLATSGLDESVLGAQAIVVTGAVTKVLNLPGVNAWIERYLPFLAPAKVEPELTAYGKHAKG
ncbi:hypothetical protein SEA_SCHMIDT_22 [Gordonia phage Schmidt]|uniref:Uncharacterized protein n=1 Tax=Gordonia phage Schmidt TaxID=2301697 RepID=A0A385E0F1_9CAUD|nr:holin [Gordonia phage Schmidt]AXQ65144.1 hypothetical protein SEA_SCHMIDT_22 [Gordonia phage Schmidt]